MWDGQVQRVESASDQALGVCPRRQDASMRAVGGGGGENPHQNIPAVLLFSAQRRGPRSILAHLGRRHRVQTLVGKRERNDPHHK